MKVDSSTRTLIAILVVAAAAVLFWMLLLSPKMKEKDEIGSEVDSARATLAQSQSELAAAETAKRRFPKNYRQLVLLGKAVPASDETASLLVQLHTISLKTKNDFDSIELSNEGTEEATAATSEGATSATEAEAALLPLGATIGSAGLAVMPYELLFTGSFFHVSDFIKEIDSMVKTEDPSLSVNGRLMTIDGFSLAESPSGFPNLEAHFIVTTYVAPPGQGLTGAAPAGVPAEGEVEAGSEETAETTEGTPSASVSEAR